MLTGQHNNRIIGNQNGSYTKTRTGLELNDILTDTCLLIVQFLYHVTTVIASWLFMRVCAVNLCLVGIMMDEQGREVFLSLMPL